MKEELMKLMRQRIIYNNNNNEMQLGNHQHTKFFVQAYSFDQVRQFYYVEV